MSKVIICLAENFEEVEGLMVVDLLRRAKIDISMVSITGNIEVTGSHSITVKADTLFEDADFDSADMIVLPGGMPGTRNLQAHRGLAEKIQQFHKEGKMLGAICAAPLVLGCNHVLEGKKACCYPGFEEELLGAEVAYQPVTADGNVITSRGLGTALEFGCEIIAHFQGRDKAEEMKEQVVYKES